MNQLDLTVRKMWTLMVIKLGRLVNSKTLLISQGHHTQAIVKDIIAQRVVKESYRT